MIVGFGDVILYMFMLERPRNMSVLDPYYISLSREMRNRCRVLEKSEQTAPPSRTRRTTTPRIFIQPTSSAPPRRTVIPPRRTAPPSRRTMPAQINNCVEFYNKLTKNERLTIIERNLKEFINSFKFKKNY